MLIGAIYVLSLAALGVWLIRQHTRPSGVWTATVGRVRLVLRVYPDQVTLRCGAILLARSPISASQPEGTLAATLPGGDQLLVRYRRDGDVATAALWADGALVAGTLPGSSSLRRLASEASEQLTERELAAAVRSASARLRAEAEVRRLSPG